MTAESRLEAPRASGGGPAVRLHARSALTLAVVSAVGVLAFGWPLLAPQLAAGGSLAHSRDAPWLFAVLLPLLLAVVLAEVAEGGMDAKAVAMLGVLAAIGAALRPLGGGLTGATPVFFLLLPAGRVLGRGFGFVLGALTLFASALLTGGVGPWLPFQMLAAGWVGFFAGCLPTARGRAEIGLLAAYGALSGLAYGLLLNLWFWPFGGGTTAGSGLAFDPTAGLVVNLRHFVAFDVATSLGFDVPRAVGNALLILVAARPVLLALRRAARRAAFDTPVEFAPLAGGGLRKEAEHEVCHRAGEARDQRLAAGVLVGARATDHAEDERQSEGHRALDLDGAAAEDPEGSGAGRRTVRREVQAGRVVSADQLSAAVVVEPLAEHGVVTGAEALGADVDQVAGPGDRTGVDP